MGSLIGKILRILTPQERLRAVWVTVLMAGLAMIEVTGILSITPFLAVLGNPEAVHNNRHLAAVYNYFGFHDPQRFMIGLGIAAFLILMSSSIFRAAVQYVKFHFTNACRHDISLRLVRNYTRQPYSFFLSRNSSDLLNMALTEVDQFINNGLMSLMQLVSYGFVASAICLLLLIVSWKLAFIIAGTIGLCYALIYWRIGGVVNRLALERRTTSTGRYQITGEIFGGIKELKVLGREAVFLQAFEGPSSRFSAVMTHFNSLSEIPRYLLEILGFCALFLVVLYTVHDRLDLGHALPLIGLYAFAGYRLLPAAQSIYASITALRFCGPVMDTLKTDLERYGEGGEAESPKAKLTLRDAISFRDVSFTYPGAAKPVFARGEGRLPALASIGVVGPTGAGKSTLIDLILGLLMPTSGQVLIDGVALTPDNARAWQADIGYVPQSIFLSDDTVTRNIAFGIPDADVDRAALERASRLAQIHDFIAQDLPQGYQTVIGERGVRLSGGQRQRLGIARALYHNPDVLIFDEATSALDSATENDLMTAIENLFGQKTIIMIAHRRETLRKCDFLLHLEGGGIRIERHVPASAVR